MRQLGVDDDDLSVTSDAALPASLETEDDDPFEDPNDSPFAPDFWAPR
jgi:hypothetical protein